LRRVYSRRTAQVNPFSSAGIRRSACENAGFRRIGTIVSNYCIQKYTFIVFYLFIGFQLPSGLLTTRRGPFHERFDPESRSQPGERRAGGGPQDQRSATDRGGAGCRRAPAGAAARGWRQPAAAGGGHRQSLGRTLGKGSRLLALDAQQRPAFSPR
jgi:hypothetical protein